ncbi:MAG: ANTAR domain-containing protein [Terracoccus sp.]
MRQETATDRIVRRPPTLPPTGGGHADLHDRLAAAERALDDLKARLGQDREVGIAIGILMAVRHIDEENAQALLVGATSETGRTLDEVAHEVVRASGPPSAPDLD